MTIQELNFLQSSKAQLFLERHASDDQAALFRLLFKASKTKKGSKKDSEQEEFSTQELRSLVDLIDLRQKASSKFSQASKMFFNSLALEQATNEKIARYLAQRFKSNWRVADLSCGLGGNLIFLAETCQQVIAIDKNELNLKCAQINAQVYNQEKKIKFVLGSAEEKLLDRKLMSGIDAFFLDPARDRLGKTKTRSLLNSRPSLIEILPQIFSITKNLGVKISPAFDYRELELLEEKPEIEVISEDNTNKVVMLWFGVLKSAERRATILRGKQVYTYPSQAPQNPAFSEQVLDYLYLPNKALTKAHLVDDLALQYNLFKLSPYLPFLSSKQIIKQENPDLWRLFKVLALNSFSWSALEKFIAEQKLERANIIVKELPFKPEEVYRRTKLKEGGELFLILYSLGPRESYYLLGKRI